MQNAVQVYLETYIRAWHGLLKSLGVSDTVLFAMATAAPELMRMRLRSKTPPPSTAQIRKRMRAKTPPPRQLHVPRIAGTEEVETSEKHAQKVYIVTLPQPKKNHSQCGRRNYSRTYTMHAQLVAANWGLRALQV